MLWQALGLTLCCGLMAWSVASQAETPQRVVSLDLCTDWILAQHADQSQVAALSPMNRTSALKESARHWPRHEGTLESIIELRPDLIITGEYNAIQLRNRLKALGFRVEVLALPTSLGGIRSYEQHALSLLNKPASQASPEPIISKPAPPGASMQENTLPSAQNRRLLLLGANGVGTGQNTFEDDVLTRAGWQNYIKGEGYQQLDLERIVTDPPEAILWASTAGNALANRFAEHPALRRALPASKWLSTDYWRWQCPGPWTWGLITELNEWLE